MQALGEAVAAGKGLSQMNIESVFEEYESEHVVNDEEHSEPANTGNALSENAAAQVLEIPQEQENLSDEVSTHKDALTITDADDTNEDFTAAEHAPAEEDHKHEITDAENFPDTTDEAAAEQTGNVPDPHADDLEEGLEEEEQTGEQIDEGIEQSLEVAEPAHSIHEDDILDLEEEREDDEDDLEEIPIVDHLLGEADSETQNQTQSHAEGLSDLEDDFDDNLDGDDTAKELEGHVEATGDSVSVPSADVSTHSKRSRPEDEDNADVPAKKQQLESHHSQHLSGSDVET